MPTFTSRIHTPPALKVFHQHFTFVQVAQMETTFTYLHYVFDFVKDDVL